jgi:cob(I)alamin adenosyltransferase
VENRSDPIYTKTGDAGQTGLFDGTRVSKADPRVDAYGDVDELNAWLGFVRAHDPGADLDQLLAIIQRDLFALGATLADPRHRIAARVQKTAIDESHVTRLEQAIDALTDEVPKLRRFILPGGSIAGASLHLARTVCRRAERRIVGLGPDDVPAITVKYMNRLSDLLFAMARAANTRAGAPELEW